MKAGTPISSLRRDLLILFIGAVVVLALGMRQIYAEYLLSRHSQPVEATVISKSSGHGWIEYSYVVAGHTYEGSTPAISVGRPFEKVSVGDRLTVRFDPTSPGVSGTPETQEAVTATLPFVLFGFAGLTAVVLLRNAFRKR
jgi:Protein of unknown function (DUF3592)